MTTRLITNTYTKKMENKMKISDIDEKNYKEEILNSKRPVVAYFWAPWCMPCKAIAPAVETVAADMKGKVKVVKCNVDDSPELATQLAILNIPTLVLFKDGKEATRITGVVSKEAIEKTIRAELG